MLATPAAQGASSRDYPGPCIGETNAVGVPLYLAADYHGTNPVFGVVILSDTGRFKLGISCVATGFVVVHVGPDSALCTVRGLCTPDQLMGLTQADIETVQGIPNEVPFFHICQKHGFGWYDAVNVPAGIYVAIADSQSGFFGLVDGHGTSAAGASRWSPPRPGSRSSRPWAAWGSASSRVIRPPARSSTPAPSGPTSLADSKRAGRAPSRRAAIR
jgi:hypothetical protein